MALAAAVIGFLAPTAPALAVSSRAEYVSQVDPICRVAVPRIYKAFVHFGKAGQKVAGPGNTRHLKPNSPEFAGPTFHFFAAIETLYGHLTDDIATVPPAPGDEPIVASWLQARETVRANLDHARRLAKKRKLPTANKLFGSAGWGKANYVVKDFGFKYCAPPDGALIVF